MDEQSSMGCLHGFAVMLSFSLENTIVWMGHIHLVERQFVQEKLPTQHPDHPAL